MNNVMKRFYHTPQLVINDFDNINFFTFSSTDNLTLSGLTYIPHPNSHKWIISLHWFAGDKFFGLYHAQFLTKLGYNVMSFDFRGHAKSDNDTSTLGIKEVRDTLGALAWLKANHNPEQVVLLGTSMGAYITNHLSLSDAKLVQEYKIKFGISDCGFGSLESLFQNVRNRHLHLVPKRKTKQLVKWLLKKGNKVEAKSNINLFDANLFKLIEQGHTPSYPIFFSHAKNDGVTPGFDTMQLIDQRAKLIQNDDYILYNYCIHTQALRSHFKTHVRAISRYVALMDNNQTEYEQLVKEWKLDEMITKKDLKDEKLS